MFARPGITTLDTSAKHLIKGALTHQCPDDKPLFGDFIKIKLDGNNLHFCNVVDGGASFALDTFMNCG